MKKLQREHREKVEEYKELAQNLRDKYIRIEKESHRRNKKIIQQQDQNETADLLNKKDYEINRLTKEYKSAVDELRILRAEYDRNKQDQQNLD